MIIYELIWLHFIGDFLLQTDQMAMKKSSSLRWLLIHVMVYSLPFLLLGWRFAFLTGLLHLCVDFWTSRWTAALWQRQERHWFFVVIGFDQALHFTALYWAWLYIQS